MICNCGYKFDDSCGIYGCPNCLGECMTESKDERRARLNRERVQRHRDKKRENLVKVEVWVKPEHREKLLKYIKRLS